MPDDVMIRAEGLGKKYMIGHDAERERYIVLREVLVRGAQNFWRRIADMARGRAVLDGDTLEDFWALKDVSFEVKRGEVLGIIGRNGAGKSTLLKILSRITEPTEGRVTINGRVASLLEVGTGFHSELTGRQNIYLNGAILGMSRAEIRKKFDEIVEFAEVEKFLDTPVKRYSSGMYVRLAFAVAAHLEPEILIVDEVLAVGDTEFQKKCLRKMSEVAGYGRTVLFVSHYMPAVVSLASRALWLQSGHIHMLGEVKKLADLYLSPITGKAASGGQEWEDINDAPGNEFIRIHRIEIVAVQESIDQAIDMMSAIKFVIEYWNLTEFPKLILNLYLFAEDGASILESLSVESPDYSTLGDVSHSGKLVRSTCILPGNFLNEGNYFFQINFLNERLNLLFYLERCAELTIRDTNSRAIAAYGRYAGYVHPRLTWRTEAVGIEAACVPVPAQD